MSDIISDSADIVDTGRAVIIDLGDRWAEYDDDGNLLPPSAEVMARGACRAIHNGSLYVPQIQWVKDYAGQVTDGRIGRPVIQYGPISWLSKVEREAVMALLQGETR
jgi:hypothetical protein